MIIDQTRYDAFWRNPEKYRLNYEVNLVPVKMGYGLERGSAFHLIAEGKRLGLTDAEIKIKIEEAGISGKPASMAWVMYAEYERRYPANLIPVIAVEQEFIFPIPGSPHSMAGRIDQIIEHKGTVKVGELKTANARAQYDRILGDWHEKKQADFEIIGARHLGYGDIDTVLVRIVVEKTPVDVWEVETKRSEQRLNLTMLNVHQTCETIEMYRRTFGTDHPWPHINLNYPCNKPGTCEMERICMQTSSTLGADDLEGYRTREEHLECLRRK